MSNIDKIIRPSIGIGVLLIFGYVLSFAKEVIFAAVFGINSETDALVVALQIPVVLFAVVGVGVRTVVLPLYVKRTIGDGEAAATLFARNVLTISIILSMCIVVIGMLFANHIVYLFSPGFDTITHDLTVMMLRISFPMIVFSIQTDVYRAILHARKKFFAPQLASYFQSLVLIVVVFLLANKIGIYAAIIGSLLGVVVQYAYILLVSRKVFIYRPYLNINDSDIRQAGTMLGPVVIGIGFAQINRFVERIAASNLIAGSISALSYASKIMSILAGLLVQAIATVVYPAFSEMVVKKNYGELNRLLNLVLSVIVLVIFPLTGGLLLLNEMIISTLFGRGQFDNRAVLITGTTLAYYSIGLVFVIGREIISRVYFSFGDTKTPMVNSVVGIAVNIILVLLLRGSMKVAGLALASSISSVIICGLLLINLKSKYKGYHLRGAKIALTKAAISAFGMTLVLVFVKPFLLVGNSFFNLLLYSFVGFNVYLGMLILMRTREVLLLWDLFVRFIKTKLTLGDLKT